MTAPGPHSNPGSATDTGHLRSRSGESVATHDSIAKFASRSGSKVSFVAKPQRFRRLRCTTEPGLSPVAPDRPNVSIFRLFSPFYLDPFESDTTSLKIVPKHFIFNKFPDRNNCLKIVLQVLSYVFGVRWVGG